ncbi:MAG: c-type cytochrome [Chromatiales bacterium]|jgi:cytochrome c553|nr:c-type cytochrome [Chromatiales bacterium]
MNLPNRLRWLTLLIAPWLAFSAQAVKLSPTSMTLQVGESGIIKVSNVKGTATLTNSNPATAGSVMANGKIVVTANTLGSTTLSVTDSKGTKTAKVTVLASMSVSPGNAALGVGQSTQLTVSNANGKIKLKNSNSKVVKATLSGNVITLKGLKTGNASLTISDKKKKVVVPVSVTSVTPPPVSGSSNGRLLASNCFQCHGTNGSGGFDKLRGSDEVLEELREFASGKEGKGIMAAHAAGYTDAQMKAIADYLANQ